MLLLVLRLCLPLLLRLRLPLLRLRLPLLWLGLLLRLPWLHLLLLWLRLPLLLLLHLARLHLLRLSLPLLLLLLRLALLLLHLTRLGLLLLCLSLLQRLCLRSSLLLLRLPLLACLPLLLWRHSSIGFPHRRGGSHVAICRKGTGDGHARRSAMIHIRKLGVVVAGRALILQLRPHRRSVLFMQRRQFRGPCRHAETACAAVVTHAGGALIIVHGAVVTVLRP